MARFDDDMSTCGDITPSGVCALDAAVPMGEDVTCGVAVLLGEAMLLREVVVAT